MPIARATQASLPAPRGAPIGQCGKQIGEERPQLLDAIAAQAGGDVVFELGDELAHDRVDIAAPRGGAHEPCAPVARVRDALDIAAGLEVAHEVDRPPVQPYRGRAAHDRRPDEQVAERIRVGQEEIAVRVTTADSGGRVAGGREHTIRNESDRAARGFVTFTDGAAQMEGFLRAAGALAERGALALEDVLAVAARHGVQITRPLPT